MDCNKCPAKGSCSKWAELVRQDKLGKMGSSGNHRYYNNGGSLGTGLVLSMAARLLVFSQIASCSQGYHRVGRAGGEMGKLCENPTRLAVLTKINQFFLNKHSQIYCLWLISWDLKKSSLIIFANILIAFIEKKIFRSPYSVVSPWHPMAVIFPDW